MDNAVLNVLDMVEFDTRDVTNASVVLRALRNPMRIKLLTVIKEHPGIKVRELYLKLKIEQVVASQHLAILRQSGIVRTQREGRTIHYYLHEANIRIISLLVKQLARFYVSVMSPME